MIAGMVPMALGMGEGGEQSAPLGRAVIGGLAVGTMCTLFVLPAVFAVLMPDSATSPSVHPDDPESSHYDAENAENPAAHAEHGSADGQDEEEGEGDAEVQPA
jgi:hypothetical protein